MIFLISRIYTTHIICNICNFSESTNESIDSNDVHGNSGPSSFPWCYLCTWIWPSRPFCYIYYFIHAFVSFTGTQRVFCPRAVTKILLKVMVLLHIAWWLVHKVWKSGDDPDSVAIPYLTAFGDLIGIALLTIAFEVLKLI